MPQKNVVKQYQPRSFYHVYNHAVPKEYPLESESSKLLFLHLISRYIDGNERDSRGMLYPILGNKVEVLAFCLLPNHFHLLLFQHTEDGVNDLMKRVITAFVKITNKDNDRRGALFETAFKASQIENDAYLMHIVRYIHLNPLDFGQSFEEYGYSSYQDYKGPSRYSWLNTARILGLFDGDRNALTKFTDSGASMHLNRK